MRINNLITMGLAIVFGLVAVVLTNLWLEGQLSSSQEAAANIPSNTLVVASSALVFGTTLSRDNLKEIEWPSNSLPQGSFKRIEDILNAEGNRQILTPIGFNEPILVSKITGPGQRATLSALLSEGMKAVSIRVNDVLGVAGFVLPGDRVDILLNRKVRIANSNEQNAFVDVLLQNVKVLAIDQIADESKDNPTVVKSVTVEVSTRDAQKLILAADTGRLALALREAASEYNEMPERISLIHLSGETPNSIAVRQGRGGDSEHTVRKRDKRVDVSEGPVDEDMKNRKPRLSSVNVFRGLQMQTYEVPSDARK